MNRLPSSPSLLVCTHLKNTMRTGEGKQRVMIVFLLLHLLALISKQTDPPPDPPKHTHIPVLKVAALKGTCCKFKVSLLHLS